VKEFGTWLFDCDGVILDSNSLKTEAFRRVGLAYGTNEAEALVNYHVTHGGMSRHRKLRHFFREILGRHDCEDELREALARYAAFVGEGLRRCPEVPGVREFLARLRKSGDVRMYVVSGSDQEELRGVFQDRGLAPYFDGIFGSPAEKPEIVRDLCSDNGRGGRAVFCGDSRLDYEAAIASGIEFVMIYGYTEWTGWRESVRAETICARDFRDPSLPLEGRA
jgi:phosphoglycolate phosphatase-like HAD superfamily hydrolase